MYNSFLYDFIHGLKNLKKKKPTKTINIQSKLHEIEHNTTPPPPQCNLEIFYNFDDEKIKQLESNST